MSEQQVKEENNVSNVDRPQRDVVERQKPNVFTPPGLKENRDVLDRLKKLYPDVKESDFVINEKKKPMILYNRIHDDVLNKIKESDFSTLRFYKDENPLSSFLELVTLLSETPRESLESPKVPALNDFVTYIKSQIPVRIITPLFLRWIPAMSEMPNGDCLIYLLIRLAYMSEDPRKTIFWLSRNLYSKDWSRKTCLINHEVCCICRCTLPPAKSLHWALIDSKHSFKLYSLKKTHIVLIKDVVVKNVKSGTGGTVILIDTNDKEVCTILPADINQQQMWCNVFEKSKSPFPYYLSSFQMPMPGIIYNALYSCITASDNIILTAVTDPSVTPPNSTDDGVKPSYPPPPENRGLTLMTSLLEIYKHAQRVSVLIGHMVAIEMDATPDPAKFLTNATNLGNLVTAFVIKYARHYYNNFVCKLIKFVSQVDYSQSINSNPASIEVNFFSSIKYIVHSLHDVPPELRHFASIIAQQSNVFYNNMYATYQTTANFFLFRVLIFIMQNPVQFGGNENKQLENNIDGYCDLLKIVFKFGNFQGNLETFNDRLNRSTFRKLQAFIYALGGFCEAPEYSPTQPAELSEAIQNVFFAISYNFISFIQRFNVAVNASIPELSLLQVNMEVFLNSFFKHRSDSDLKELSEDELVQDFKYFGDLKPAESDLPASGISNVPPLGKFKLPPGLGAFDIPIVPGVPQVGDEPVPAQANQAGKGKAAAKKAPAKKGAAKKPAQKKGAGAAAAKKSPAKKGAASAKSAEKKAVAAKPAAKKGAATAKKTTGAKKGAAASRARSVSPAKKAPPKAGAKKAQSKK